MWPLYIYFDHGYKDVIFRFIILLDNDYEIHCRSHNFIMIHDIVMNGSNQSKEYDT